jgi:hypothetical protein
MAKRHLYGLCIFQPSGLLLDCRSFGHDQQWAPERDSNLPQPVFLGDSWQLSSYGGGLNGSTQHSARTHLALKTKGKIARYVRSAGTLPWLGFD